MAAPRITAGGKERIESASALYKDAFRDDPVVTYMLCNLSIEARYTYLMSYFRALMTGAGLNNAIFEEAADWSACSVLMPPGCRADNTWTLLSAGLPQVLWKIGFKGCYRMLGEYAPLTDAAKAKGLKGAKEYWYIFFVATDKPSRGKGLSSALLRKAQERAQADGLPLWLEATTEYSWKLYAKLGFETVEELRLGEGVAAVSGTQCKGGPGLPIWAMVWWPPKAA